MSTALFFDLDGTLLDTARDFAYAINLILKQQNKPLVDYHTFRTYAHGESKKMVEFAFQMDDRHSDFEHTRQLFLNTYHQHCTHQTTFFPGVETLLNYLDTQKIPWGIVTNKPTWLTTPILSHFKLNQRAACVITGDTLRQCKPNPEPLLLACKTTRTEPNQSVYVGDLESDVIAAKRAGMKSIAVSYGYHAPNTQPDHWNADFVAKNPVDVLYWTINNMR